MQARKVTISAFLAVDKRMKNISNVESGSDGLCFGQFTSLPIFYPHYTYRLREDDTIKCQTK